MKKFMNRIILAAVVFGSIYAAIYFAPKADTISIINDEPSPIRVEEAKPEPKKNKDLEAVKQRPEFVAAMENQAEQILLEERQINLQEEIAAIEIQLEQLRAEELSFTLTPDQEE